ncbi:MAG: hypothetical protein A3A81_03050 [Omnitrophica bacterium RIFCSPLOWO2_01_FULL_45_10b]|nr:MAG: hypothetical protein A3A81_03050 [Omnitrophica bacterium RIFCSPLOWO2_01_FULL_45_10b]
MPEINLDDTIAAISTPPGEGGIGIVRLSGEKAIEIAGKMFRKTKDSVATVIANEVSAQQNGGSAVPGGGKQSNIRRHPEPANDLWRAKDLKILRSAQNDTMGLLHRTDRPAPEDRAAVRRLNNRRHSAPRNDEKLEEAQSHLAQLGYIYDGNDQLVDEVLITVFHKPRSYTAEDVVEISAHGGFRVLRKILDLALSFGARQAEPGEFTRRAFLNGRLDLTQAEAVLDLIRSKTDGSLEVALRQLTGKLSQEVNAIKNDLMKLYAHVEAYLDFPDEHLEIYSDEDFKSGFKKAMERLSRLIKSFSKGQIFREGACVTIAGRPNVGKSSLLNALLDRDRALVSEIPGTTRDILEESIELAGLLIRLVDTAGLWESDHPLDQAAIERTKRSFQDADLFLWVLDATTGFTEGDRIIFEHLKGKKVIPVINKIDIKAQNGIANQLAKYTEKQKACFLSAKTREGIETLEKEIVNSILEGGLEKESVMITRLRHQRALSASLEALEKSFETLLKKESLEFVALDLKQSLDALKEFVGEIYSEDLLDAIFSEFCIGK